jgi:HAD superfamily hydrolase (TIGR01509 family)
VWALAFEPNKALLRLVDRVRRQVRTGLLTNNSPLLQDSLPELLPEVHRRFDPLLFSYQFGALKPSAALFTAVLVQSGLPAQDILLIDDAPQNVEGARAVGMQACLFTSVARLRTDLTGLVLPRRRSRRA